MQGTSMSTKKTRTILEELNSISIDRNKHHVIENRVQHLVSSVENIKKLLHEYYESDVATDLERRLLNSLKSGDFKKFSRGIRRYVNEQDNSDE